MTDNSTPANEPTDVSEDSSSVADDADRSMIERQTDDLDPQDARLSEEAAKWRRQARAEETNRRLAEARVELLQRNEIDRHLATKIALADDFWLATDVTVPDLLNEDGTKVDIDKVDAAVEAVLEGREHWRAKLGPVGAPSSAVTGDGKYQPQAEETTWDGFLKKGGRLA